MPNPQTTNPLFLCMHGVYLKASSHRMKNKPVEEAKSVYLNLVRDYISNDINALSRKLKIWEKKNVKSRDLILSLW